MTRAVLAPYACLAALGGLRTEDAALVVRYPDNPEHDNVGAHHPLVSGFRDGTMEQVDLFHGTQILLPPSRPAVAQVLARHWGHAPPNGRDVLWFRQGSFWVLQTGVDGDGGCALVAASGPALMGPVSGLPLTEPIPLDHHVPALADLDDPNQALAEALVWEARLARLDQWARGTPGHDFDRARVQAAPDPAALLTAWEKSADLPVWTVEVSP